MLAKLAWIGSRVHEGKVSLARRAARSIDVDHWRQIEKVRHTARMLAAEKMTPTKKKRVDITPTKT